MASAEIHGRIAGDSTETVEAWESHVSGTSRHGCQTEVRTQNCSELPTVVAQQWEVTERHSNDRLLRPTGFAPSLMTDCHVQHERCLYFVPYRLVGQALQLRLCASTVEVFDGQDLVTTHPRRQRLGLRHDFGDNTELTQYANVSTM